MLLVDPMATLMLLGAGVLAALLMRKWTRGGVGRRLVLVSATTGQSGQRLEQACSRKSISTQECLEAHADFAQLRETVLAELDRRETFRRKSADEALP